MPVLRRWPLAALVLGGVVAGASLAQSRGSGVDSDAPPPVPGQVLSDVHPLPAEDRESAGAVLLDQSPVRAQQPKAPAAGTRRDGTPAVGGQTQRLVDRMRTWDDVREAESKQVPAGEASGAPPEPATPTR